MKYQVGSFPHPVIGIGDDVDSVFNVTNPEVIPATEDVEVRFRVRTTDPTLIALLRDGSAAVVARWLSTNTFKSGLMDLRVDQRFGDGVSYVAWLDQREIVERVNVNIDVVAGRELTDFSWERQHPDYGGTKFHIEEGDILAVGESFDFYVDKLFDPRDPPVGSFLKLHRLDTADKEFSVDLGQDDYIRINLPTRMADGFEDLFARPDLQISIVVLPALIQAITFIRSVDTDDGDENLESKSWVQTLRALMKRKKIAEDEPAMVAAQKVLDYPVYELLNDPLFVDEPEDGQ